MLLPQISVTETGTGASITQVSFPAANMLDGDTGTSWEMSYDKGNSEANAAKITLTFTGPTQLSSLTVTYGGGTWSTSAAVPMCVKVEADGAEIFRNENLPEQAGRQDVIAVSHPATTLNVYLWSRYLRTFAVSEITLTTAQVQRPHIIILTCMKLYLR